MHTKRESIMNNSASLFKVCTGGRGTCMLTAILAEGRICPILLH